MCVLSSAWCRIAVALAIAVFAIGCGRQAAEPRGPAPSTNIILISIDTLRPDHLGCYGYGKPTSPALDRLCAESQVYVQAIAQAPSTLHSHASMLSSMLPHHHGASWGGKTRLPEQALTLAEVLAAAGYKTAAFTGGGQMDRIFGLDQGFDLYEQPGESRFSGTVARAVEWIDNTPERPFFLFLHSYEVHHPYTPSAANLALMEPAYSGPLPDEISIELLRQINLGEIPFDDADLAHVIATYDAEIRSVDDGLAVLLEALEERSLYQATLIVFTSDHGEEFGEHGVVGWHSHTLFDELLRVPLVFHYPNGAGAGRVDSRQVRLIDLPPTLVAAVGLPVPEEFDGVDLNAGVGAQTGSVGWAISRLDRPEGLDISSVRSPDWKMIQRSLYDLNKDPGEQWDTALNERRVLQEMTEEVGS